MAMESTSSASTHHWVREPISACTRAGLLIGATIPIPTAADSGRPVQKQAVAHAVLIRHLMRQYAGVARLRRRTTPTVTRSAGSQRCDRLYAPISKADTRIGACRP